MNTKRRILVTGCSSGFGRLTALELAERGHSVVATVRSHEAAEELRGAGDQLGRRMDVVMLDVRSSASIDVAISEVVAEGPIDGLVNNAGIQVRTPLEFASDDDMALQFDTNVFGPIRMIRAVLPMMRERRDGIIVNVSSVVGLTGSPFEGLYSASKWAIEALSEALYFEMKPFGVRVAVVEPGGYPTNFIRNSVWGTRTSPGSAYREGIEAFDIALERQEGDDPEDPGDVARRIADVVEDDGRAGFRHQVGRSAQKVARLRRVPDFGEYEEQLRESLDWWT
jgi:NAD(P)-dependent dehydrogenase (short-subunit alcohol dehydrogenase family)